MEFKGNPETVGRLFEAMRGFKKINPNNIQIIGLRAGTINGKEEMLNLLGGADKKLLSNGKMYMDVILSKARITVTLPFQFEHYNESLEDVIARSLVYYTKEYPGSISGFSVCFIPYVNGVYSRAKSLTRIYIAV